MSTVIPETLPATFEAPKPSGADPSRSNLAAMRHFRELPPRSTSVPFVLAFIR